MHKRPDEAADWGDWDNFCRVVEAGSVIGFAQFIQQWLDSRVKRLPQIRDADPLVPPKVRALLGAFEVPEVGL